MKAINQFAVALLATALCAVATAADGPQFDASGALQRPADYRQWVFLTSGLGMAYGAAEQAEGRPAPFTNVFVKPDAWSSFMQTGVWPEGTVFVLEVRRALEAQSINQQGRTQGDVVVVEASVKDSKRFPDGGWAYFDFGTPQAAKSAVAALPRTEACYTCHRQNAAVEWTFTQFYPEQFEVATKKNTVRPDYDPARKAH
jgi:hypothetical protein